MHNRETPFHLFLWGRHLCAVVCDCFYEPAFHFAFLPCTKAIAALLSTLIFVDKRIVSLWLLDLTQTLDMSVTVNLSFIV
jgi:hypothetical protein